jgi:hypothetical protein
VSVAWGSLLVVAAVSAALAVTVVCLVAVALAGLSLRTRQQAEGTTAPRSAAAGVALAVVCLSGAVVIGLYGLYVIAV